MFRLGFSFSGTRPEHLRTLQLSSCKSSRPQQKPLFQGVLCPNGCELKTALLKQERTVRTVKSLFWLPGLPGGGGTSPAVFVIPVGGRAEATGG